jgi:hypothetical protein
MEIACWIVGTTKEANHGLAIALNDGTLPGDKQSGDEVQITKRPMAGEVLRSKQNPSVAQVMAQRAFQIDNISGPNGWLEMPSGCDLSMTMCLIKWDAKAAVPLIRRCFTEWRDLLRRGGDAGGDWGQFLKNRAASLVLLADPGIEAGDDLLAEDYAAWIHAIPEGAFPHVRFSLFLPVWRHPENAKLAGLARWAFQSESSFWHPDHKSDRPWWGEWTSPLLAVPAFREMLKRELADDMIIGSATFHFSRDQMSISLDGIWGQTGASRRAGNCPIYVPDVEVRQSLEVPLRRRDEFAYQLSGLEGVPRFELYWPETKRAATRAEIAGFFDRWGDAFRERNTIRDADELRGFQPSFRLAKLSQPATAEDAAAGRAIFSLRDWAGTQVRVVPLKPFPSIARWKTLERFRLRNPVVIVPPGAQTDISGEKLKTFPHESFDREGRIWQAEEVLIDGQWRRFYGFVGNHIIARVPAEEIEFLDDFTSAHPNGR